MRDTFKHIRKEIAKLQPLPGDREMLMANPIGAGTFLEFLTEWIAMFSAVKKNIERGRTTEACLAFDALMAHTAMVIPAALGRKLNPSPLSMLCSYPIHRERLNSAEEWVDRTFHETMLTLIPDSPADAGNSKDNPPPARSWTDPVSRTVYTFDTDHQFEVWSGFASNRYPVNLAHLCNTVRRWSEGVENIATAAAFIKNLRKWWRLKKRDDIARRIKLTATTVQLVSVKR